MLLIFCERDFRYTKSRLPVFNISLVNRLMKEQPDIKSGVQFLYFIAFYSDRKLSHSDCFQFSDQEK